MLDAIIAPFSALHTMRELGGPVVNWIFIACAIMWGLTIERLWYFSKQLPGDTAAMLAKWNARPDRLNWSSQHIRRAMISRLNSAMSSKLQVLRVLVPMCPCLLYTSDAADD